MIATPIWIALGLSVLSLLGCAAVWLLLSSELARQRKRADDKGFQSNELIEGCLAEQRRLDTELRRLDRALTDQPWVTSNVRPGMNFTLRGQIIRLYRLGKSEQQIAQDLRRPLKEVQLIVKVFHQLMANVPGMTEEITAQSPEPALEVAWLRGMEAGEA